MTLIWKIYKLFERFINWLENKSLLYTAFKNERFGGLVKWRDYYRGHFIELQDW